MMIIKWSKITVSYKKLIEIGLFEHEDPKALIEYSNNMQDIYKMLKSIIQVENEKCEQSLVTWLLI